MYSDAAGIGADIGRNSIRIGVVKIDGTLLFEESVSLQNRLERDQILEKLIASVQKTRQKAAESGINTITVGIAARGFIDHQAGIILGPDHGISGWKDVPLAKITGKETGLPVFVGNDANLMTVAEHRFGSARGFKNVVFVALRTGIGGGIIINGKLYRGVNNAGGEIGQMIINFTGVVSETGIIGSYEHLASGAALISRYYEEAGLQQDTEPCLSAKDIFDLGSKGDETARRVISENASLAGVGLANLITIFAPEIIVLGGGMAEGGSDYIKMIKESAFRNSLENCRAEVRIEKATLGPEAALIGAGYYGLIRLSGKSI
jgi:glucokinase